MKRIAVRALEFADKKVENNEYSQALIIEFYDKKRINKFKRILYAHPVIGLAENQSIISFPLL
jgi:hypothetical protein